MKKNFSSFKVKEKKFSPPNSICSSVHQILNRTLASEFVCFKKCGIQKFAGFLAKKLYALEKLLIPFFVHFKGPYICKTFTLEVMQAAFF